MVFRITTERLVLEDLAGHDLVHIQRISRDPIVMRYVLLGLEDDEQVADFFQRGIDEASRTDRMMYVLAVRVRDTRDFAGLTFLEIDPVLMTTAESGCVLLQEYWANGYASEILRALLAFGFNTLSLHRIYGKCDELNLPSASVMEKCGLQYEGTLREHVWLRDHWRSSRYFGILAGEYNDTPSGNLACIPLTESNSDEAARVYREVFLADEPTTHTRSPDPARFLHYAKLYTRFLAGKNLSFVARDGRTNELAGFIFCVDITGSLESAGEWTTLIVEDFREAMTMINELEDRYINLADTSPGSILHIFQVGQLGRKYRGHGIAQLLIHRALANAQEHGFRMAVADCTNPASRRSFEQCGFHEVGFSSYEEFSLDGNRYFSECEGGIWLMARDI